MSSGLNCSVRQLNVKKKSKQNKQPCTHGSNWFSHMHNTERLLPRSRWVFELLLPSSSSGDRNARVRAAAQASGREAARLQFLFLFFSFFLLTPATYGAARVRVQTLNCAAPNPPAELDDPLAHGGGMQRFESPCVRARPRVSCLTRGGPDRRCGSCIIWTISISGSFLKLCHCIFPAASFRNSDQNPFTLSFRPSVYVSSCAPPDQTL